MNGAWLFLFGLACGSAAMGWPRVREHIHAARGHGAQNAAGIARAHSEERFTFTARAPMERVAPLFGADKERVWSPDWNPQFVYPLPAADARGMVFTVAHGHRNSVWANTEFDLKNGRVQYVYVIPDALVTVITLRLAPAGDKTHVEVEYERTALSAEADEHVREMAKKDRAAGPEWERQIGQCLAKEAVSR